MLLNFAKLIYKITSILLGVLITVLSLFLIVVFYYGRDLPDYNQLSNYTPPLVARLYSSDGKLLNEYAVENRIFTSIDKMPKLLLAAFLSAEDKNFYNHSGLDIASIIRASFKNVINFSYSKSLVGGSTITQQVVKNFLLTNEKSFKRKIKEAILSFRINRAYSKDKILELYLNQIYLGNRSYGVTYAALSYFDKTLDQLSIQEIAFLASLPKGPSNYDPKKFYNRAITRRNWVIERMKEENFITNEEAVTASKSPIETKAKNINNNFKADFFSESVRREIANIYGDKNLYESGFNIYTTIDSKIQMIAERSFREGLLKYDKKYGYRGELLKAKNLTNWRDHIKEINDIESIDPWSIAVIKEVKPEKAIIETENKDIGHINISETLWAKSQLKNLKDIFKIGDIIAVEHKEKQSYLLRQVPKANGGLVVMEPATGKILAMVGGFSSISEFNRATQAKRQPGSAFKPFVYLSALENGYTPSSIILDGPIELYQGPNLPLWRPKNYSGDYLGPTTLRRGLEKSRNTMTVRLGQAVGINKIIEVTKRFNINKNPPRNFSIVLGATETSLIDLTNAYSIIVNGGKKVSPTQIDYIQDSNGSIIYRDSSMKCENCQIEDDINIFSFVPPETEDNREQIIDPVISYQMISMLEGVVQRGTARQAAKLGNNIGGKTGTTNNSNDVWFIGFSKNMVVGTYIGYDNPKTLGKKETGASTALPVFVNFMEEALKVRPNAEFIIPSEANITKINPDTGLVTDDSDDIIYEIFRRGTEPSDENSYENFEDLIDQ